MFNNEVDCWNLCLILLSFYLKTVMYCTCKSDNADVWDTATLLFCHNSGNQVLHFKCGNLGCSSAEGRSSTANSGTKAAVLPGIE